VPLSSRPWAPRMDCGLQTAVQTHAL
jgi:hypothetical protein